MVDNVMKHQYFELFNYEMLPPGGKHLLWHCDMPRPRDYGLLVLHNEGEQDCAVLLDGGPRGYQRLEISAGGSRQVRHDVDAVYAETALRLAGCVMVEDEP